MEELKSGDIINERYTLVRFLGSGSFGEVWLAHDQMTGRDVALKIYLSLDPAGVEEFQREYANTADLSSPYLLTPEYFDVFHRRPFLVMKYCELGSSSKLAGNISEEQLWAFIEDVSKGLEVLHSQADPIVHQDIKPDNILMDNSGNFLITDFGISKRLRATMRRQSKRNVSSGAMPYMAPERFESNPKLNTASDIWSLGASIYELVTGELPFSGFGGAMQRHGAEMPSLSEHYSPILNQIMQRCLSEQIDSRPNAGELSKWATERTVPTGVADLKLIPQPSKTISEATSQGRSISETKFRWVWLILIGIIIVSGYVYWQRGESKEKAVMPLSDHPTETNPITEEPDETTRLSTEEPVETTKLPLEQQILNSNRVIMNGEAVHFYKGAFYYGDEIYPVRLGFITFNGSIQKAIYKNDNYGGRITMRCMSLKDEVRLVGKDGSKDFIMILSSGEDDRLIGSATEGNKNMTVRLMPTSESFDISARSNVSFTSFKIGDGSISLPSFLTYRGESDEGGPMFMDSSEEVRLFVDYSSGQDINSYRDWVNNEMGTGTTVLSKDNCFVQTGYTYNREIYYCKAYVDRTSYPAILYTAIIVYPPSRREFIDGLIAKIFNTFPNIK